MTFNKWYDWMAIYYAFVLGVIIGLVTTSALVGLHFFIGGLMAFTDACRRLESLLFLYVCQKTVGEWSLLELPDCLLTPPSRALTQPAHQGAFAEFDCVSIIHFPYLPTILLVLAEDNC
jgi:hypothetical protein